jgi:hypothetical protein
VAGPFDFLFPSAEQGVLRAQRQSLNEQLNQAGAVVGQAATRGAANPVALAGSLSRAQQGTRSANAAQFAQQLQAAREADRNMAQRLIGTIGNVAGSALAMAIPGAGPVASPIAGAMGSIASMGAPKSPQAPPAGPGSVPGMAQMSISPQEQRQFNPQALMGQTAQNAIPMPQANPMAQAVAAPQPTAVPGAPGAQPSLEELRRRSAAWLGRHPASFLAPERYQ